VANAGSLPTGDAPGVALTRLAGSQMTSLTLVAASEIAPAAEAHNRYAATEPLAKG
jgi:hypothetical protein